jgi:hypothetical protein
MKRKYKALGLVLAAVFAFSAVSVASASAAEFHSKAAPTTITGVQKASHVFTTNAGKVTCTTAKFTGTQSVVTSATVTLTPTYENCTAFGFVGITIDTNGCKYNFNANGSTKVECPTGKAIEVTVPFCTTSVGSQTLSSGMSFATEGTEAAHNRKILATTNISGITYNECGTVRTNGTYTGTTTVTGSAGEIWFA